MITIYTITFNEQLIFPLFIKHYRSRFPNCHIVVYDNKSTDNTLQIAKDANCEIRPYDSGGKLDDSLMTKTKNSCWKTASTDFVCVCDTDELLDINQDQLIQEQKKNTTIIRAEAYHMVNSYDNNNLENITHGFRWNGDLVYDKDIMFNRKYLRETNWIDGCHDHNQVGKKIYSQNRYNLFHYKYKSPTNFSNKQYLNSDRFSKYNFDAGSASQALRSKTEFILEFEYVRNNSIKIK